VAHTFGLVAHTCGMAVRLEAFVRLRAVRRHVLRHVHTSALVHVLALALAHVPGVAEYEGCSKSVAGTIHIIH
jgi:hypothetical protein